MRLARASLRVTATISAALSPPEPESLAARPSPVPTAAASLSQFQFAQPHRCGEEIPKARVTLRSVTRALLLQSPVQRAGRAGRPSEASPYASVHESRDGRLVLTFISYIRRAPLLGFEFASAGDAHLAPVAPQGKIQTLGEHGLPCRRFDPRARHGAPVYGAWRLWN